MFCPSVSSDGRVLEANYNVTDSTIHHVRQNGGAGVTLTSISHEDLAPER